MEIKVAWIDENEREILVKRLRRIKVGDSIQIAPCIPKVDVKENRELDHGGFASPARLDPEIMEEQGKQFQGMIKGFVIHILPEED